MANWSLVARAAPVASSPLPLVPAHACRYEVEEDEHTEVRVGKYAREHLMIKEDEDGYEEGS